METKEIPVLTRIQNGWLACGDGWAVRGASKDEALRAFEKSLRWHEEVDRRPLPQASETE